jgi:sulfur carrier protein
MLINGKQIDFEDGITVANMLKKLNLSIDSVVVEVNLEIVPKELYSKKVLCSSDKIEIVSFVGGG